MKTPKIEIAQGDKLIKKIVSLSLAADITELCQSVNIVFPVNMEDLGEGFEFNPISVLVDDKKVFTGWIDTVEQSEDNQTTVKGRSLPSMLVDSQIFLDNVESKGITFSAFIDKVCGRFNMEYAIPSGHRALKEKVDVSFKPEDKAFKVLDEIALQRGFLLGSDSAGRLIVRDFNHNPRHKKVIKYIKDITYSVDLTKRFRNYQAKKDDKEYIVRDNEIKKISYMIKTKFEDASIQAELEHERTVARMSSRRVSLSTPYTGFLYEVGDVVVVSGEELLISNINFSIGSSGSVQKLGLVHADTFSVEENRIQLSYIKLRQARAKERDRLKAEQEAKEIKTAITSGEEQ